MHIAGPRQAKEDSAMKKEIHGMPRAMGKAPYLQVGNAPLVRVAASLRSRYGTEASHDNLTTATKVLNAPLSF